MSEKEEGTVNESGVSIHNTEKDQPWDEWEWGDIEEGSDGLLEKAINKIRAEAGALVFKEISTSSSLEATVTEEGKLELCFEALDYCMLLTKHVEVDEIIADFINNIKRMHDKPAILQIATPVLNTLQSSISKIQDFLAEVEARPN